MKKRKPAIIGSFSRELFRVIDDYVKNHPTPKYKDGKKPKNNLERFEVMIEIAGPERTKAVVLFMEKNNMSSLNFADLVKVIEERKAKRTKDKKDDK